MSEKMEAQELEAISSAAQQDAAKAKTAADVAESAASVAKGHKDAIELAVDKIVTTQARATQSADEAERKLKELRETLKNSITASLGGAFGKKADEARFRDYSWLVVLCVALYFLYQAGSARYEVMSAVIDKKLDVSGMLIHFVFSFAIIAGPLWLAWFSTKRLASTYAICEDYEYKAAIAQAYQGYLDSSKGTDKLMEERLFATVVTQLDASPVRFITKQHAGTPWQDLIQQPFMQKLLDENPTLLAQFKQWFKNRFGKVFESQQ
jgi:hypothetical protein